MVRLQLVLIVTTVALVTACAKKDSDVSSRIADRDTVVGTTLPDKDAAEREIREQGNAVLKAFQAKDPTAISAFYATDALIMPPDAKSVNGPDGVRGYWTDAFKMPNFSLDIQPLKVVVGDAGDMAYETGTYSFSGDTPQGQVKDEGKYMVVWRRVNGAWKIVADIWNSDGTSA